MIISGNNNYTHLAANATTAVKASPGILHSISVNKAGATANTCAVYDSLTGTGTVIAVIDTTVVPATFIYDIAFATGLTVVTATGTAADITVAWQ